MAPTTTTTQEQRHNPQAPPPPPAGNTATHKKYRHYSTLPSQTIITAGATTRN
jgi:hypothetical protein